MNVALQYSIYIFYFLPGDSWETPDSPKLNKVKPGSIPPAPVQPNAKNGRYELPLLSIPLIFYTMSG